MTYECFDVETTDRVAHLRMIRPDRANSMIASFWRDLPPPPHNNAVFVDSFAYGTTPPRLPFYSTGEFRQAVTDGMTAITLDKATPADVVANVESVLNKYLQTQKKS